MPPRQTEELNMTTGQPPSISTLARVRAVLSEHTGTPIGQVADDMPLFFGGMNATNLDAGNMMLDSLDRVELVMRLEEEFSLEVPDEDVDKHSDEFSSIARIAHYLDHRAAEWRV
jgi:acyl carrier protein